MAGALSTPSIVLAAMVILGACKAPTGEPHRSDPAFPPETSQPSRATTGEATLLLMADIRGVLRPCGCTVDLQKGGFDRLGPFLEATRHEHEGARLLHAGPLFFATSEAPEEKHAQRARQSAIAAELVAKVGIDVVGLSAVDMRGAGEHLTALVTSTQAALTVANMEHPGVAAAHVLRSGGLDVGVFALASPAEVGPGARSISDPKEAARRAVEDLSSRSDVIVLLSALGLRETKRVVRAVEGIDFAVAGGLGEHPVVADEAELVGATRVMQFHREGRFVGRLTIRLVEGLRTFVDASAPSALELQALDSRIAALAASLAAWSQERSPEDREVKSASHHLASLKSERDRLAQTQGSAKPGQSSFSFRVTPLNWDLPQDPDLLAIMDAFDRELKEINLAHVKPLPEAQEGQAVYVGVPACLECHEETEDFWEKDKHSHAWETLEKGGKTFDAECVSCHVTGYGQAGGSTLGQTKGREDVQCEACHGPGSLHVESEGDVDIGSPEPAQDTCVQCHNDHHSPRFNFPKWKKRLMVPGHGLALK